MLFNSFDFLVFFIVVTFSYFLLPHKYRWSMLLTASCIFYMWFKPEYLLILLFTIVVDYFAGIYIENSPDKARKKRFLIASIIVNVGFLCIFKYYNFFNSNITGIALLFGAENPVPYLGIVLPVGLSFHTFQAMSYTIEVYRGNQNAERHFGIYALYVMFYPQLVAGPIERPQNLIHQFHEKHSFDYNRVKSGLKLMGWGFFKKVVIADRLAAFVNEVYGDPASYTGVTLTFATVFFAFQIYCDFSGYSDIAIGAARVMGFKLMRNFNRPYFSKSISEFWGRWHISLSTWFRDYVYIPLGGNRVSSGRRYFNLLVVFLLSGFWHGANWTFIVWGALHGTYLIMEIWLKNFGSRYLGWTWPSRHTSLMKPVYILITFSLTCFAWIFFRAENMNDALYISGHLFSGWGGFIDSVKSLSVFNTLQYLKMGQRMQELYLALFFIFFLLFVQAVQRRKNIMNHLDKYPLPVRWSVYLIFFFTILVFGFYEGNMDFIYFQF
jgi:alginate O-acetyltransferase complex protein AlgI